MAGTDSGTTIVRNTPMVDDPSIRAASIRSLRQGDEEVPQQEDPERQGERRVGQPDPDEVSGSSLSGNSCWSGRKRDLDRDHHQGHDHEEDRVAERELQPRERVGRQRADRRSGSSVDGIEMIRLLRNARPMPCGIEHLQVIPECETQRREDVSHQPVDWMSARGRNEVISRPIVGASQITATIPRAMWIGVRPRCSPGSAR